MDPNVRRLAAVWFADIVGYTSLSSSNEQAALRVVALFQSAARAATAAHGGRLVHFMGDAALAEFNSTDAAMKAAVRLQRDFAETAAAAGHDGCLRIGVHVGDVVQSPDGDVFGDGVNTAARLQEAARPGQIVCSQDVWRHLRPRGEFGFDSLGERQLTGIQGLVWLFSVRESAAADSVLGARPLPVRRTAATRSMRIVRLTLVYLLAALVIFELTRVVRTTFDLPLWLTPLASALLAVGLLVMLVTGWVQSRPTWDRRVAQKSAWTLDLPDLLDAMRERRLPELTWPRALAGGAVAFGILFASAAGYQHLRDGGRRVIGPRQAVAEAGLTLAILPFQAQGAGADVWSEGMPDLLGMNLADAAGIQVIDPLAVMSRWNLRSDSASPHAAVDVGRDVGARFVLAGDARTGGNRLHFTARLYDVRTGLLLDSVSVDGSLDSVAVLADSLGARVLRAGLLPAGQEAPALNLGRLATTSVPALRAFLEGEQQFRRSRWTEARDAFDEAVNADPEFAFALYRLSLTTAWSSLPHEPTLDAYARMATERTAGLPDRQARLIRAHGELARNSTRAISILRELTRDSPGDVEGWFLLGDAYYHLGEGGVPSDSFRIALRRGIELDPAFGPPYLHLIEDAVLRDDTTTAQQLIAAYRRVDPRSPLLSGFDLAYTLMRRERESAESTAVAARQPTAARPTPTTAAADAPPPPDRSGYDAALRAADTTRREALAAGSSRARLAAADSLRLAAETTARRGRFADAAGLLDRARLGYEEARAGAIWAARLDSVRSDIEPLRRAANGSPDAPAAAAMLTRAAEAEARGRYVEALQELENALRAYSTARPAAEARTAAQPPAAPAADAAANRIAVEHALERIAQAIEGENSERLLTLWPSLSASQRESFRALFAGTRDIEVRFDIVSIDIDAAQATASLQTTYAYYNEVDRKQDGAAFAQVLVFSLRDGQWLVTASR